MVNTIINIDRRAFLKLSSFVGGNILILSPPFGQLPPNTGELVIWSTLVNAVVEGIHLANDALGLGEKISGLFHLRNQTSDEQQGGVRIYVYNILRPTQAELQETLNVTLPPQASTRYELPSLILSTPGRRVVEVQTAVNKLSAEFRYGSFCCDSRGNKRCPVPYTLSLGTDCLCNGVGAGNICE